MARFKRQLFDQSEHRMDVSGSEPIRGQHGGFLIMASGSDGTAQYLRVNADGELITNAATGSTTISGAVDQGDAGTQAEGWFFRLTDGTQVLGTGSSAPIFTSGSVHVQNFPAVQEITGTVALQGGDVNIGNFPAIQVITGTVDILNPVDVEGIFFPAVQEITGTVALQGGDVNIGNFPVTQSVVFELGATATRTNVTASIVSTQILAANVDRKGVMLYVSSAGEDVVAYIGFGTGPITTADASFLLYSDDAYNLEQHFITAPVQSIFNLHTGSVRLFVTEIT